MAGLSPQQLQIISQEYYTNGFVLGRDKLYQHLQVNMNPMLNALNQFDSRDQIADWLKRQPVNTIHSRQRKPTDDLIGKLPEEMTIDSTGDQDVSVS